MTSRKQFNVVKTAQMANTLKLLLDGKVVGSIVVVDAKSAELRDHREHLVGTFRDPATAIAEFQKVIGFEEIGLDL